MSNEIDARPDEDQEAQEAFQQENEARKLEDAQDMFAKSAMVLEIITEEQRECDATQIEAAFRDYVQTYGWPSGSELVHGELNTIVLTAIWKD